MNYTIKAFTRFKRAFCAFPVLATGCRSIRPKAFSPAQIRIIRGTEIIHFPVLVCFYFPKLFFQ